MADKKDTREQVSKLIRDAWDEDQPAGWFEPLYARAAEGQMKVPWAFMEPNPDLTAWLDADNTQGDGQRALVIGCGLGDDAEALAGRGFDVTAFDVSATAIKWARERFPETTVDYQVADLLNPPAAWKGAFDFVLEIRTIQALPHTLADDVIAQIAGFVAPGGRVLVMCRARDPEAPKEGIPWALSRRELATFTANGLQEVAFDERKDDDRHQIQAVYRRPAQ